MDRWGVIVLVLEKAGLVYLANPKTATQSLRAMLQPFADATPVETAHKHINAQAYARRWAPKVQRALGAVPETFAVMRAPIEHMGSWFRYRQREALRGHENSTHGLSFADFIKARLSDDPPPFARLGRQDRFLGFLDAGPPVTYVFDYANLGLLLDFLEDRLGTRLTLPHRNTSPEAEESALTLPSGLLARYQKAHATEFALYERVREAGMLQTVAAPLGQQD